MCHKQLILAMEYCRNKPPGDMRAILHNTIIRHLPAVPGCSAGNMFYNRYYVT